MASIDHDAVECNASLREREGKFEMRGIGGMIEVDGDGDGGLVGSVIGGRLACSTRFRGFCACGLLTWSDKTATKGPCQRQG